jgi:ketosteroid isomerase-like protein
MKSAAAALFALTFAYPQVSPPQAPLTAPPQAEVGPEEAEVRAAVQQYFDAQARHDVDAAVAVWSASANPRPTREAYATVFGTGEDSFIVTIQRVAIQGNEARVRVLAVRTRLTMRDGTTSTSRQIFPNAQLWRKEASGWKLLRDGPFAQEIADEVIAASSAERPSLFEKYRADLVQTRQAISERATMAITLGKDYGRGKALFTLALEVARAAGDRVGEANSLHNIAQASYFLGDHQAAIEFYEKERTAVRWTTRMRSRRRRSAWRRSRIRAANTRRRWGSIARPWRSTSGAITARPSAARSSASATSSSCRRSTTRRLRRTAVASRCWWSRRMLRAHPWRAVGLPACTRRKGILPLPSIPTGKCSPTPESD